MVSLVRPKAKAFKEDLCFAGIYYYSFFLARSPSSVSRSPQNFAPGWKVCSILECQSKILGALLPKIIEAKNTQKWMTSKFDGKYIQNGWRYLIYRNSYRARRKKSGELWSSNHRDIMMVKSYPPKSTFLEDHISAPSGWCAPKFL